MKWRAFLAAMALLLAPQIAQAACPAGAVCVEVSGDMTVDSAGVATVGAIGGKTFVLGGALTTTGAGAITLAFPATTQSFTFPTTSKTLLATDLSNIGATVLPIANLTALPSSNFFAGDAGGRPIAASVTGDLGFGAAAAGFVTGTVTGLRGISLDASPSNGYVPVYRSSGNHIAWEAQTGGGGTPANPTGTAGPTAVNGSASTYMRSDGAPAVQKASSSQFGIVEVDGTTITATGGVISAPGSGSPLTVTDGVNSVASTTTLAFGSGLLVGGSAGTATLNSTNTLNPQSGTGAYAILAADGGLQIVRTNASGGADTIGAASATGFTAGYSTMYTTGSFAGNTITPALGTIGGLSVLKFGKYQSGSLDSDGTNYNVALSYPVPPDQTGSRFNLSNMLWTAAFTDGQIPVGQTGAAILPKTMSGDATLAASGALTVVSATTSTAGKVKLHNVPVSIGWPAGLDPNNTVIAVINQASTISAIVGALETANGATATVTVNKAGSGTACSAGSAVSSSFNANSTAATNQTLTSGSQTLAAGDRLCLQTTGTWTGGGGSGIGTITVFLAPT